MEPRLLLPAAFVGLAVAALAVMPYLVRVRERWYTKHSLFGREHSAADGRREVIVGVAAFAAGAIALALLQFVVLF